MDGKQKVASSKAIVKLLFPHASADHAATVVRTAALYFLQQGELPFLAQGKHIKVQSLIHDEDVRKECDSFFRGLPASERTVLAFINFVNGDLLARLGLLDPERELRKIKLATGRVWLLDLGWVFDRHQ